MKKGLRFTQVIYPGSFDPIHCGHVDIIERISKVYPEVVILIAESSQKASLFTPFERKHLIEKSLMGLDGVRVEVFSGLIVDYLRAHNARVIVRGLRAVVDFEYEISMANMNRKLFPESETMLVFASPEYYYVSSRGIKEIAVHGGNLKGLVPPVVEKALRLRYQKIAGKKVRKK